MRIVRRPARAVETVEAAWQAPLPGGRRLAPPYRACRWPGSESSWMAMSGSALRRRHRASQVDNLHGDTTCTVGRVLTASRARATSTISTGQGARSSTDVPKDGSPAKGTDLGLYTDLGAEFDRYPPPAPRRHRENRDRRGSKFRQRAARGTSHLVGLARWLLLAMRRGTSRLFRRRTTAPTMGEGRASPACLQPLRWY